MFIQKVSASSWKDYEKCQYMFLQKHLLNKRLPFVGTVHTCFGTACHYCTEVGIAQDLKREKMDNIFIQAFNKELVKSNIILPDNSEWMTRANFVLNNFWNKHHKKLVKDLFKTEWKFKIPLLDGKLSVNGIIDLCTITKNSGTGVIDYKTGKMKSGKEYEMQLSIYSLAIQKLLGKIPDWFCLMFLEHDKNKFFYRDERDNKETEAKLVGFYNNITSMEEEDFKHNDKACFFCDYKHTCKHICGDENGNGIVR